MQITYSFSNTHTSFSKTRRETEKKLWPKGEKTCRQNYRAKISGVLKMLVDRSIMAMYPPPPNTISQFMNCKEHCSFIIGLSIYIYPSRIIIYALKICKNVSHTLNNIFSLENQKI